MPEGGRLAIETQMERIDHAFCRFYPYATPGGTLCSPFPIPESA
jgi:hypothetical protein